MIEIDKAVIVEVLGSTPTISNSNLEVRPITKENLTDAAWFNDEATLDAFVHFIDSGHLGFYCYQNGVCIFRTWIFTHSANTFVGRNFVYQLAKNEVFSGWSETAQEYRGLGAFPFTLNYIIQQYPQFHISAYIAADNHASIKGVLKTGFTITRKFTLIKYWRIRLQLETFRMNKKGFFRIKIGGNIESLLSK
jgi:hypothetical protein